MKIRRPRCLLACLAVIAALGGGASRGEGQAATTPGGEPLSFECGGSVLAGVFFKAAAPKPAPVAILVHGYPGRDGDLFGLGRFLQHEGIHAYAFNYRGAWRSGGLFSLSNAIADVAKAVEFLSSPDVARRLGIDPSKIALVGYSLGAGIVLLAGDECPSVSCLVSIATTNLRLTADALETDAGYRGRHLQSLQAGAKAIRGAMDGPQIQAWLLEHREELDLTRAVDSLPGRRILFIGGWNDAIAPVETHMIPLYRTLRRRDPAACRMVLLEAEHSFGGVTADLQLAVLEWIRR